ncbi:hypothetical protein VPH35_117819 [Triticum aestivum]|uniref:Uncharacterized protein n=1 Tax=Aegilops tauschii subsp. strangulata TaxID=200361 RepID=A0A453PDT0_AEGTS
MSWFQKAYYKHPHVIEPLTSTATLLSLQLRQWNTTTSHWPDPPCHVHPTPLCFVLLPSALLAGSTNLPPRPLHVIASHPPCAVSTCWSRCCFASFMMVHLEHMQNEASMVKLR